MPADAEADRPPRREGALLDRRGRIGLEMAVRGALAAQQADAKRRGDLVRERLDTVLQAAARVPVYRERYGDGVSSVREPDDLWRLPAVTKEDLVEAGEGGRCRDGVDLDGLERAETSGSTGPALTIPATARERLLFVGNFAWGWRRLGVGPDERALMLAAPHFAAFERPGWIFAPPDADPAWILERFLELRPTLVTGSTESIALLGRAVADAGEDAGSVRWLLPFGQTLTDHLRAMTAEGFEVPPLDMYGCCEAGWLGAECPDGGMHVPDASVVVQIAKVGRPDEAAADGERGEVVVTSLLRSTTPFVRYRLGDVAALERGPCPCGADTPRLTSLEGRVQDFLLSTGGALVSPGVVATQVAHGRDWVEDHRIVQEAPERVVVYLVAPGGVPDGQEEDIAGKLRAHLGPVRVELRLVDDVPRDPSGKRRRVYRAFDTDPGG